MESANLIPPAFVTHDDIYFSENELSFPFSKGAFPEGSTFSAYVDIAGRRIPLAIAADPAGVLKVQAKFIMQNADAFISYPVPEGDRYAHTCEPSPVLEVKLGIVSYQNALPGPEQEVSFKVLKGGLHQADFRLEGITYLTRKKDARLNFLSRQPLIRKIHPREPAGLMYLANLSPVATVQVVTRQFIQGGSHVDVVMDELQLESGKMYFVPADVTSLQIPEECFAYEVFLLDPVSEKRYSEVRMYHVDRKGYQRVFIVAYENALGGYETLYFSGDDSQSEKITSSETVNLANNPTRLGKRINVEGNLEFVLRSGFYIPGLEVAFRELLYSPDVYFITPGGGKVPVIVDTSDMALLAGEAPNPSSEITFKLDSPDSFPLHQILHF